MILNKCYFISYFGKYRNDRRYMLEKAVKWAKGKEFEVTIIAQEWEEEDYKCFPECEIVTIPHRIPPGHARNIALNMFYAGDDDWCLILDDDTWIEVGHDIIDTIRDMDDCGNVYCLTVLDTVFKPEENSEYHILHVPNAIQSGVFLVRNGLGQFFNPGFKYYPRRKPRSIELEESLLYGEDVNFLSRCLYAGKEARVVLNARANLSRDRKALLSTWWEGEKFLWNDKMQELSAEDFDPHKNGVSFDDGVVKQKNFPQIKWRK